MRRPFLNALRAAATVLAIGTAAAQTTPPDAQIARGRYLATAADCAACHTNPFGGKAYAGGYGIASPLGSIYATNITPSKQYGIGDYSLAQFTRVLREGIRRDGAHLYPAMPYTSYTKLTDADIAALYAYFMHDVAPVNVPGPKTSLPFPFNIRASMIAWNALFLDEHPLRSDPNEPEAVNRGRYMAIALGHCDTCHTPRNELMAEKSDRPLAGAAIASWYAPNITNGPAGIGDWTEDDLVQYLKTGDVPGKAQAAGPMAEAVEHSFQYLTDGDLHDIAAYIKHAAPLPDLDQTQPRDAFGHAGTDEALLRGNPQVQDSGERIYQSECASCHRPDGRGSNDHYYPQIFRNSATGANSANNLIAAILLGVDRTVDGKRVYMPGFGASSFVQPLSDREIADVANHVLKQFGNAHDHVTPDQVAVIRQGGPKPFIAQVSPYILPAMIGGGILAILLVAGGIVVFRRRATR